VRGPDDFGFTKRTWRSRSMMSAFGAAVVSERHSARPGQFGDADQTAEAGMREDRKNPPANH
jgi:hypothetical protein